MIYSRFFKVISFFHPSVTFSPRAENVKFQGINARSRLEDACVHFREMSGL